MKKRIMSLLLVCCMVFTLFPATAFAEDDEADLPESGTESGSDVLATLSGNCGADGSNVHWALTENDDNTYTLTISGDGAMNDYGDPIGGGTTVAPWYAALAGKADAEKAVPITEITVEEGVTKIGSWAFAYTQVEEASFAKSVKEYGIRIYSNCLKLTTVDWTNFHPERVWLSSTQNAYEGAGIPGHMFDHAESLRICKLGDTTYTDTLVVPDTVKAVGDGSFYSTAFTTVDFSDGLKGVETVAFYSFAGMPKLKNLYVTARLQYILGNTGSNAFSEQAKLDAVAFEEGVTEIPKNAFRNCDSLKTLSFPSSLTHIGEYAFNVDKALEAVDLTKVAESLTVDTGAFNAYESVGKFKLCAFYVAAEKVADTLQGANHGSRFTAHGYFAVTNGGTFKDGTVFAEGKLATPVKANYVFTGWYKDAECTVSAGTPEAGTTYYAGWKNAETIGYCGAESNGRNVSWRLSNNGDDTYTLEFSGKGAMADYTCNITRNDAKQPWRESETGVAPTDITKVVVGSGVTNIGNFACDGLSQVKEYNIAKTVETIGVWGICGQNAETYELNGNANYTVDADGVLMSADGKTMVSYPGGAAAVDEYVIPNTVETVSAGAFVGSDAKKVVIPYSVTSFPSWSFAGSTVEKIEFNANVTALQSGAFSSLNNLSSFVFGKDTPVSVIASGAFADLSSLKEITFPDTLTELRGQSFKCLVSDGATPALEKVTFGTQMPMMGIGGENPGAGGGIFLAQDKLTTVDLSKCTTFGTLYWGSFGGTKSASIVFYFNDAADVANLTSVSHAVDAENASFAVLNGGIIPADAGYYKDRGKLVTPTKDGYVFQGWYTKDGTNDNWGDPVNTLRAGETYYAKWYQPATLTTNIGEKTFVAGGDWVEFTFSTVANDDVEKMVTGGSDFGVQYEDKIAALEYKAGNQWIDMKGKNFGGSTGFPMTTATSTFRVKFTDDAAGTYSFKAAMTTVNGNEKLCEIEVPFIVNMQTQAAPENAPTLKERTYTSITLNTVKPNANGAAAQYSKDGGQTWQDSPEFTGLTNNTTYTFAVRYAEKAPYAASDASTTAEFSTLRRSSSGSSSSSSTSNSVTVSSTKNGDVTVSPKNASKGTTVTITVDPDKGYELDTITVKDANGKNVKLTDKGNGKYTFTMPASKVTVSAEFAKIQTASTFADVPTDAYYAKAVEWAVQNGITNGKGNGLFGSNDPCTRGQIVTFLWRAAGSPAPKGTAAVPADVVPGSYCYDAVAWALENGITNGLADGTFGVNNTCTRGQSVTFLYRAVGKAPSTISGFTDVAADSFCADAVAWAVENGVTNGTSATTFSPNNGCTRAQIVTFLYRAYQSK